MATAYYEFDTDQVGASFKLMPECIEGTETHVCTKLL